MAREKKFLQNFIFYHPYESINFQPAGLLKIALIVTPLFIGLPIIGNTHQMMNKHNLKYSDVYFGGLRDQHGDIFK